jgi:hypothetical protein
LPVTRNDDIQLEPSPSLPPSLPPPQPPSTLPPNLHPSPLPPPSLNPATPSAEGRFPGDFKEISRRFQAEVSSARHLGSRWGGVGAGPAPRRSGGPATGSQASVAALRVRPTRRPAPRSPGPLASSWPGPIRPGPARPGYHDSDAAGAAAGGMSRESRACSTRGYYTYKI